MRIPGWILPRAAATSVLAVAVVLIPGLAHACAVCFGDADAPETKAMAVGILFMLGCIGTVLAGFAGVFCYWAVRSHRLATTEEGATN